MDTQALQLHEKVQKLIEQYTIDKKRLNELETALKDKSNDNAGFLEQISKLKSDLQTAQNTSTKLAEENNAMKKRCQELEQAVSSFENFAGDLNSRIDDLIPKIDKL